MADNQDDITELKINTALSAQRLGAMEKMIEEFIKRANETLLTKAEFEAKHWPVRVMVFGLAGAVLMAVITAILSKVLI